MSRRSALLLLGGGSMLLAGCSSSMDSGQRPGGFLPEPINPAPGGDVLGSGSVRVALLLPLSAQGNAAGLASAMRNAAELGLNDFRNNDLTALVKDTGGTPEGAAAAVNAALSERVELIIGPLFAAEVRGAGSAALAANVPMLSFSSDPTVASPGVYVMGFLVNDQVRQIVARASSSGRRSMAALIPDTPYGTLAEASLRQAAAGSGIRLVQIERYSAADLTDKARIVAGAAGQIDSVFVPEGPGVAPQVAAVLGSAGIDPARVKMLGSGQWNDPAVYGNAALNGAWFPAPDIAAFQAFAARYRSTYGSEPPLTATLAYDAIVLAAGLVRAAGPRRFEQSVLANQEGFLSSVNGLFRFTPNGGNDRGLAIYEVTGATPRLVAPAPRSFTGS
ncbi:MAG TPA: penicillin-binding protein activator [Methylomirabilota bacterium]|nr:penicillin-binding protein activator [Methylomirabilota bacterium]